MLLLGSCLQQEPKTTVSSYSGLSEAEDDLNLGLILCL